MTQFEQLATGLPAHVTVTAIDPSGIATVTFVVAPPLTVTGLVDPLWSPFVAETVTPEPAGTFVTVTWPLTSVVVPAVMVPLMLPPVSVTVAPLMGDPADWTVTATVPTGIATGTLVVAPAVTVAAVPAEVWPLLAAVRV